MPFFLSFPPRICFLESITVEENKTSSPFGRILFDIHRHPLHHLKPRERESYRFATTHSLPTLNPTTLVLAGCGAMLHASRRPSA